jgi:UDP-3-O-[3-hydroxymyristoyl] N-acetylglucosamine deacetylase
MGLSSHQRTVLRPVTCEGIGLHSGKPVRLTVLPGAVNSGIRFIRVDLPGKPEVPALHSYVVDTALATTLGLGPARVATVEHFLAAVSGLSLDNLRVELNGPELPIMDGSATPFCELLGAAGVRLQSAPRTYLVIRRPVTVRDGDKHASFAPARSFRIACTIDFRHPLITDQSLTIEVTPKTFIAQLAKARTFGFVRDVERLRAAGLAQGGSLSNAVVVDEFSILNPEGLRSSDEFVRHKVLDAIGDLALLGYPIVGAMTAFKTGHALNQRLVREILSDADNFELRSTAQARPDEESVESGELAPVGAVA